MKNRWSGKLPEFGGLRSPHPAELDTPECFNYEIDAALAVLARVQPASGLEQRVKACIAQAHAENDQIAEAQTSRLHIFQAHEADRGHSLGRVGNVAYARGFFRFRALPGRQAFAASLLAAVALLCGVLLYSSRPGSIDRRPASLPSSKRAPSTGFGAAAAIRVSPRPGKPLLQAHARGTLHSGRGRSSISTRRKPLPPGVAVPNSPVPKTIGPDVLPAKPLP